MTVEDTDGIQVTCVYFNFAGDLRRSTFNEITLVTEDVCE